MKADIRPRDAKHDAPHMQLNADFTKRASMHANDIAWLPSPTPGVNRRMLERIGGEVARATTIVRYDAGSKFPSHVHDGGEELFVLDGVFQDEHGDFPAGSYIRNPPQSAHAPASHEGCTIFVKLWQFDLADRTQVRIDTRNLPFNEVADRPGVSVAPLFENSREDVRLERWPGNASVMLAAPGGVELLVLDGDFTESGETFKAQSWLRLPKGSGLEAKAGPSGAQVWMKLGHLARPQTLPNGQPVLERQDGDVR
jgi:quercetin dioxygenase-like cupin family protein